MTSSLALTLVSALSLSRSAPPSKAATPDDIKRLVRLSIREYEAGEFEQALADAQKAFDLSGTPALLFNVGQCHRALEHWRRAELAYRSYLRTVPDAPNRAQVLSLLAEVQAKRLSSRPAAAPAPSQSQPAPGPVAAAHPVAAQPGEPVGVLVVNESAVPVRHGSHALSWTFFAASAVAAGVAAGGAVRIANYESLLGQISAPNSFSSYERALSQAQATHSNASNWQVAAVALGVLAALGVTAGVLSW